MRVEEAYRLPSHLLLSISPETLRQHVIGRDWSFSASQDGRFDIFARSERDLDQVLIPLSVAAPDYAQRMAEALQILAETERRPVEQLLTDLLRAGNLGYFRIPGEATRRDYAVYIMVVTNRETRIRSFYVGKTGDNRDGCNPVISRVGNHLSFNIRHAQMRARVAEPEKHDFDFFYTTFGTYVPTSQGREHVDVINEMERQLNLLAQQAFGTAVMNPYGGRRRLRPKESEKRTALATPERLAQLQGVIAAVRNFLSSDPAERGGQDAPGSPL